MVALFAAVHLLLFFPVPDKHLRLRLIKHVFWLRVTAHVCVCVCSHNCIHADEIEKRCRGIYLWYSIVLECVFCVYVHMSPLCRLFFFFLTLPWCLPIMPLLVFRWTIDSATGYKLRFKCYVILPIEFYI